MFPHQLCTFSGVLGAKIFELCFLYFYLIYREAKSWCGVPHGTLQFLGGKKNVINLRSCLKCAMNYITRITQFAIKVVEYYLVYVTNTNMAILTLAVM